MTEEERKAFEAMRSALYSIHEVDDFGDGYATVTIDYVKVVEALDLADRATGRRT